MIQGGGSVRDKDGYTYSSRFVKISVDIFFYLSELASYVKDGCPFSILMKFRILIDDFLDSTKHKFDTIFTNHENMFLCEADDKRN